MPARLRRDPDPVARAQVVASFDRCAFDLRGGTDFTDAVGLRYGDRVEIVVRATVVREASGVERDGMEEHVVTLDPYDAEVLRILDELVPRRRRRRRAVARRSQDEGDAARAGAAG